MDPAQKRALGRLYGEEAEPWPGRRREHPGQQDLRRQRARRGLAAVDEAHDLGVAVERDERVEVGDGDRAELEGEHGGLL